MDRNIYLSLSGCRRRARRGSREPCGSKLVPASGQALDKRSRLARALWSEISCLYSKSTTGTRRGSREPCGSKYSFFHFCVYFIASRLARALWIEIPQSQAQSSPSVVKARESLMDLNFTGGIYFFIDLVNKIA